jgi:hypothetical protein
MSAMKREEITRRANALRAENGIVQAPVPVEQIAVAQAAQIIKSAAEWSGS